MDQIANMINMIKNGNTASHESIVVPYSKIKESIAECLVREGYLSSVSKKTKKGFPTLELGLAYNDGTPKVTGVERVSKPSRRIYRCKRHSSYPQWLWVNGSYDTKRYSYRQTSSKRNGRRRSVI
jgi:ribosomal protein S8